MPVDKPKPGETQDHYLGYCIAEEIKAGRDQAQAAAICYSYWRKDKMSKITDTNNKVMARVNFDSDFKGINLLAKGLEDACWEGYEAIGTKMLDGREVPNCVPKEKKMAKIPIEIIGDNEEKVLEYLPDVKSSETEDAYLERCVIVLYPEYVDEQAAYSICADKYQRIITKSDTGKTE